MILSAVVSLYVCRIISLDRNRIRIRNRSTVSIIHHECCHPYQRSVPVDGYFVYRPRLCAVYVALLVSQCASLVAQTADVRILHTCTRTTGQNAVRSLREGRIYTLRPESVVRPFHSLVAVTGNIGEAKTVTSVDVVESFSCTVQVLRALRSIISVSKYHCVVDYEGV